MRPSRAAIESSQSRLGPTLMTTLIPPNPPRWEPSEDPSSIVVPGLDASASVNDQIDQIEQLITIKLQVRSPLVRGH